MQEERNPAPVAALKTESFSIKKLLETLPEFSQRGITELSVSDKKLSSDRDGMLALVSAVKGCCPQLFVSVLVSPEIISVPLARAFAEICCSLEIPLSGTERGGSLLFDKKLYSSKARLLNDAGLVFGFNMEWGMQGGDTFKLFRDRLDFALSLYPNHIDFAQLEAVPYAEPKPTGIYSSKDLDFSRGMAFACKTFYSCGRAVPWFESVRQALKISATSFFADFEEFQLCNSCSFESGFDPEGAGFETLEKLQLLFLQQKFEEKNRSRLFPAAADMVALNGAFSIAAETGAESSVETSYHPDDVLSPSALDIASFCEAVPMEHCTVRIFASPDGPDYEVL